MHIKQAWIVFLCLTILRCVRQSEASETSIKPQRIDYNATFEFSPAAISKPHFEENGLNTDEKTTIGVSVVIKQNNRQTSIQPLQSIRLRFNCADSYVCSVEDNNSTWIDVLPTSFNQPTQLRMNVTVLGLFVGKTSLMFQGYDTQPSGVTVYINETQIRNYRINILRTETGQKLQAALVVVLIVFVTFNTFMMGTQLHVQAIIDCLKKPVGPSIGFTCQYVIMPLSAYCFATLLLSDYPSLQFGYFAAGCSPGGGNSNVWSILLEGNLDLSMTMTFVSNVAALAMMPFWLYTVGRIFYGGTLSIPFWDVARALATLVIPASIGIAVTHFRPQWKTRWYRALKVMSLIIVVFLIVFIAVSGWYIFLLMTWRTLLAGCLLPTTGYLVSYIVALLITRNHRDARTIAIETGIQNTGIAMLICQFSLDKPDSDLTIVMPASVAMFTGPPLWIWLLTRTVRRKCCGYIDPDIPADDPAADVKSDSMQNSKRSNPGSNQNSKRSNKVADVGPLQNGNIESGVVPSVSVSQNSASLYPKIDENVRESAC